MLHLPSQTAGQLELNFFVDTHGETSFAMRVLIFPNRASTKITQISYRSRLKNLSTQ